MSETRYLYIWKSRGLSSQGLSDQAPGKADITDIRRGKLTVITIGFPTETEGTGLSIAVYDEARSRLEYKDIPTLVPTYKHLPPAPEKAPKKRRTRKKKEESKETFDEPENP